MGLSITSLILCFITKQRSQTQTLITLLSMYQKNKITWLGFVFLFRSPASFAQQRHDAGTGIDFFWFIYTRHYLESVFIEPCTCSPTVCEGRALIPNKTQANQCVLSFSQNAHLGIGRLNNIEPRSSFVKRMLCGSLAPVFWLQSRYTYQSSRHDFQSMQEKLASTGQTKCACN